MTELTAEGRKVFEDVSLKSGMMTNTGQQGGKDFDVNAVKTAIHALAETAKTNYALAVDVDESRLSESSTFVNGCIKTTALKTMMEWANQAGGFKKERDAALTDLRQTRMAITVETKLLEESIAKLSSFNLPVLVKTLKELSVLLNDANIRLIATALGMKE